MIDLMIILGGFLGTVLDPFNIILLILLVIFAKNEKTKERNFLKNLGIVFLMGFGFRLLFIPLNIYASSLDYRYFGIDTAFCILFSNAIFAVLIYLIYALLYPTLKLCFMTPEEIGAYKKIKTCNEDLSEKAQIKNLIEKYENAKDFECADFLYRLMMFRDKNYTAVQIQAFLNPNENIQIVEEFLLKNLRTKMKLQKLINSTNNIAFVWYYTLNSYITNENKELVNKLWQQLNRGFELAKNKYLLDSSKIFNFDNKEFYQIPKGILS